MNGHLLAMSEVPPTYKLIAFSQRKWVEKDQGIRDSDNGDDILRVIHAPTLQSDIPPTHSITGGQLDIGKRRSSLLPNSARKPAKHSQILSSALARPSLGNGERERDDLESGEEDDGYLSMYWSVKGSAVRDEIG